jgi:hypothetical protein
VVKLADVLKARPSEIVRRMEAHLGVPRAQTQGCLVLSSLRKASADVGLGF